MTTSQLKTRIEPTLEMSCRINYASTNNAQHNCTVLNQPLSKPSEGSFRLPNLLNIQTWRKMQNSENTRSRVL